MVRMVLGGIYQQTSDAMMGATISFHLKKNHENRKIFKIVENYFKKLGVK